MTVGELTARDMPETLALMTHAEVMDARRRGDALVAASSDFGRIVWANATAADVFGLQRGPQSEESRELADTLRHALAGDASSRLELSGGRTVDLQATTISLGLEGRECVLVRAELGEPVSRNQESLRALSEIGDQPIAIWTSDRAWLDAGFGQTGEVYLEDLYDLKDSGASFDEAFLEGGASIGLAKLSRRMIAVWRRRDQGFWRFDLGETARADSGDASSNETADDTTTAASIGGDDLQSEPSGDDQSFTSEIEALKSVGGSLMVAAGAALGGAVLSRVGSDPSPISDRDRGEASWETPEASAREEVAPPSETSDATPRRAPMRSNWGAPTASAPGRPSQASMDDIVAQDPADELTTGENADRSDSRSDLGAGEPDGGDEAKTTEGNEARVSGASDEPAAASGHATMAFLAAGLGAASAYAFARQEEDADAEGSDGSASDASEIDPNESTLEDEPLAPASKEDPLSARPATAGDFSASKTDARDRTDEGDGGARAEDDRASEPEPDTPSEPSRFEADFTAAPRRFVWRLDQDGRFHALSPEFAETVGPRAAAVIDVSFADMAEIFDLDPSEEIVKLLRRRDTWSDRTILWPVEGTGKRIPVDLAALPIYSRDRSFDGFRGFGVARPMDVEDDPNAWGERLASGESVRSILDDAVSREVPTGEEPDLSEIEESDGGGAIDLPASDEASDDRPGGEESVVQLAERRKRRDTPLSDEEASAFRTIGVALSAGEASGNLENAIAKAKEKIALFGGPAVPSPDDIHRDDAAATFDDGPNASLTIERTDAEIAADLAAYYRRLPVPILVQSGDSLVFTNEEFADLTGYRDANALSAAGGLDHLFEGSGQGERMRLRRSNDNIIEVRARMQRTNMRGRSFLVISFFASPRLTVSDLRPEQPAVPVPTEAVSLPPAASSNAPEARLADLMAEVDAAGEAVLVLGEDGRIEAANERSQTLFAGSGADGDTERKQPPLGSLFTELFAGESQENAQELIRAATRDKGTSPFNVDLAVETGDGEGTVNLTAVAQTLDTGGWCVIMRDTERVKSGETASLGVGGRIDAARLEAEGESLRKTQFLASIAHEIRTPMTAILGFSDAIESEAFGPVGNPRYLDYISDIKRSGRHVLDLVNDLLALSKAEAGALELDFGAVALNQVVGEVVSMMQPVAGGARVVLRSNLPPSVPPVVADERSIRQIVTNLIQNAIGSTPAGGQIILSSQYREDGGVTLKCRDNGVGMSESELEIARTPYGRVKRKDGAETFGTGLGLPLAYAMAEANGAELKIESNPHNGTLVELRFPAERVVAD